MFKLVRHDCNLFRFFKTQTTSFFVNMPNCKCTQERCNNGIFLKRRENERADQHCCKNGNSCQLKSIFPFQSSFVGSGNSGNAHTPKHRWLKGQGMGEKFPPKHRKNSISPRQKSNGLQIPKFFFAAEGGKKNSASSLSDLWSSMVPRENDSTVPLELDSFSPLASRSILPFFPSDLEREERKGRG